MKFAIFGIDELTWKLGRDIAASESHQLVWLGSGTPGPQSRPEWIGRETVFAEPGDWFASLVGVEADAVVLAREADARGLLDTLRQLAAFPWTIFLSHPINLSVITSFEIERIREDASGRIYPLLPDRWHPAMQYFVQCVGSEDPDVPGLLGAVERIEMERRVADPAPESLLAYFARDIDLVGILAGKLREVSGMAAGKNRLPLNVQLSGNSGVLARWSALPAEGNSPPPPFDAELKVFGSHGEASLSMSEGGPWQVEASQRQRVFEPVSLADACLQQSEPCNRSHGVWGDWLEIIHSLEVTEALEKSLRRGRLVRINLEGRDESTAFKGTMVSLGCALLMGGTFLLVVSAVVLKLAQASGLTRLATIFEKVPAVLAVVLIFFLALQGLRYLIPATPGNDRGE